MSISSAQARAAQGLLGLMQKDVCVNLDISRQAMSTFERTGKGISRMKIEDLQRFYEDRGVEFLDYDGVRMRPSGVFRVLRGSEGFREFIYDVYDTVKDTGGHICVTNVDERQFERWQGVYAKDYLSKMAAVERLGFQILVREGDDYFTASKYAQYRHLPAELFSGVPTYIYGNKKAEILFDDDDVTIFLFDNQQLADAERLQFKMIWNQASE